VISQSFSLRSRLLILLMLAIFPMLGIMVYSALDQRGQEAREAQAEAMRLARMVVLEYQEYMHATRQLLPLLAQLPSVRTPVDKHACHGTLASLRESYPYYGNLGVAGLDGEVWCSGLPLEVPVRIDDRRYFRSAIEIRGFSVGEYQIGRITGVSGINFGYPIFDAQGEVEGVVFAALKLAWLAQRMKEVSLPEGTVITILDRSGRILVRQPDPEHWEGKSAPDAEITRTILTHAGEGTAESLDLAGVPRLYAFMPLYQNGEEGIYVSVGIPRAVAYAEVEEAFKRNIFLLILIASIVIAVAWNGSNLLVLRPLRALVGMAERLGRGELDARTGLMSLSGELGLLAQNFDRMAESLQRKRQQVDTQDAELRRINRALRTLSSVNRTLVRATDELSLLREMCRVVVNDGGYPIAWVTLRNQADPDILNPVVQVGIEEALLKRLCDAGDALHAGACPTATVSRTGQVHLARDLQQDPQYKRWHRLFGERDINTFVSLPLRVDGMLEGAITICAQENHAFDTQEVALLSEMAEDLAFGINALRTRMKHTKDQATIARMAYFDSLTGFPNHVLLEEKMAHYAAEAVCQDQPLAVLLFDLDLLRDINDALGFGAGDEVLREAGRRIAQALGQNEFIARVRGDEFAVILPNTDAVDARRRFLDIQEALGVPFLLNDFSLVIGVNAGIVLFPDDDVEADQLMRLADVALDQAKLIPDGYAFYSLLHDTGKKRQVALAGDLRRALENSELKLYYQPKICMRSGHIHGFEALARWFHPLHGAISPDEFIALAERVNLIGGLTDWVLEAAMRQASAWWQGGVELPIAVNLSARNLQDPQLPSKIEALCITCGVKGEMLELEITEGAIMANPHVAQTTLLQLRELGFALYIDDFGTGYSSLGYLKKLPVSAIKIDKSFVIDMLTDKDSATIVRSTISLAHDLGLTVVAEGVEDEAIWGELVALGCDSAQGYYMGKPMGPEQVHVWLGVAPWGLRQTALV
jgi:diguanylate cyclase (GGDEF)-like protein